MLQNNKKLVAFTAIIVLTSIAARFLPHIPNSVPVAALALFVGAHVNGKYRFVIPLLAMAVSDFFIGFYDPRVMVSVYGSYVVIMMLGSLLKSSPKYSKAVSLSVVSSVIFFIVTNAAVWFFGAMYAHTLSGLVLCYVMALPFFGYALAGDLFWVSVFFGGYALYLKSFDIMERKQVAISPSCSQTL